MDKALVIIPTYNEVENIKTVVEKTLKDKAFDILWWTIPPRTVLPI